MAVSQAAKSMLGHEVDDGLKRGLKMITLLGMLLVPRAWVIGPGC